jgi:hypothetical protein
VTVKRRESEIQNLRSGRTTRVVCTELLARDPDGPPVYRFTLPCDLIEDTAYLAALVAGKQVRAIACERRERADVLRQDARCTHQFPGSYLPRLED